MHDDTARFGTLYDDVAWEEGERPAWWLSFTLIWEFALPTGQRFATSNLDDASRRLANHLRHPLGTVRRALFQQVPLTVGESGALGHQAVGVTAHCRHAFLRSQTEELHRLEAFLTQFRSGVVGDVLATFANALERGEADTEPLLDAADPIFFLGVSLRDLGRWAVEFEAFEVQEFVRVERERTRSRKLGRGAQPEVANRSHADLLKVHGHRIREFCHYLHAPDFEPRNASEARALELHRATTKASSAQEEERSAIERDRYILKFVLGLE